MSTKNSGGGTASDAVEKYLKSNSGWHEVRELSNATGYDNNYVRRVAKRLAKNKAFIQKRKNRNKPVIGYNIGGQLVVPGGDKDALIRVIQTHAKNPPSTVNSMSVSKLQNYIRNTLSNGTVVLEHKLEFRCS